MEFLWVGWVEGGNESASAILERVSTAAVISTPP
jgi:hypothetical protein